MRLQQAVDLKTTLKHRISGMVTMARGFHWTSKEIHDRKMEICKKHKIPYWLQSYLDGIYDCLTDDLYQRYLIFGYEWDGRVYTEYDSYPEELKEYLRKNNSDDIPSGHWWKDTVEVPGQQKLYFGKNFDPHMKEKV